MLFAPFLGLEVTGDTRDDEGFRVLEMRPTVCQNVLSLHQLLAKRKDVVLVLAESLHEQLVYGTRVFEAERLTFEAHVNTLKETDPAVFHEVSCRRIEEITQELFVAKHQAVAGSAKSAKKLRAAVESEVVAASAEDTLALAIGLMQGVHGLDGGKAEAIRLLRLLAESDCTKYEFADGYTFGGSLDQSSRDGHYVLDASTTEHGNAVYRCMATNEVMYC